MTLIRAITIKSLVDKLVSGGNIDRKWLGEYDTQSKEGTSDSDLEEKERWYFFGEKVDGECNAKEYYISCKNAAESGDMNGLAYQGLCLIHGFGVQKNRNEGFEFLAEAANEGSGKLIFLFCCIFMLLLNLHSTPCGCE